MVRLEAKDPHAWKLIARSGKSPKLELVVSSDNEGHPNSNHLKLSQAKLEAGRHSFLFIESLVSARKSK